MTASFGVTEIQQGDTHELLLARADRALMDAKESGRNRVIQVGTGQRPSDGLVRDEGAQNEENAECESQEAKQQRESSWLAWFRGKKSDALLHSELLASVPRDIAVKKLEGFIHDYKAEVVESGDDSVVLRVDMSKGVAEQRKGERPAVLLVGLGFLAVEYRRGKSAQYQSRTKLTVSIRPVRTRDRRQDALTCQAKQLLAGVGSYMVTQEITPELATNILEPR